MKFRFLTAHTIGNAFFKPGEIAEMSADWRPTGQVEPLDSDAADAFWREGPQELGSVQILPKKTKWLAEIVPGQSMRRWSLEGLGAAKGYAWR